jgi:hypothetical protein
MAQEKPKGNIFYEILIVILTVVLIASILYPKKLKEGEEQNMQLARYRMDEILKAQLQYQKYNSRYSDTLSKVLNFIKTDTSYAAWIDTVIIARIDSITNTLQSFRDEQEFILKNIPQATDSVMIDSLAQMQFEMKFASRELAGDIEYLHDQMKLLPNMPLDDLVVVFKIVDSKQFTMDMDIVRNSIQAQDSVAAIASSKEMIQIIDDALQMFAEVKRKVPDYKDSSLNELAYCPSTGKEFELVHVDTSVIKYINIYSPIDSSDIELVSNDFLRSKIGGLKLQNHGKIESGEKSWESQ